MCSLIPEKQIRVWKGILLKGLPLYHLNVQKPGFEFFTPLDPVEQKRQDILNDLDYEDYAVSSTHLKSRWYNKHRFCYQSLNQSKPNRLFFLKLWTTLYLTTSVTDMLYFSEHGRWVGITKWWRATPNSPDQQQYSWTHCQSTEELQVSAKSGSLLTSTSSLQIEGLCSWKVLLWKDHLLVQDFQRYSGFSLNPSVSYISNIIKMHLCFLPFWL